MYWKMWIVNQYILGFFCPLCPNSQLYYHHAPLQKGAIVDL